MESHRNFTTNAVGFFLLPSELIQYIIFRLALPDVVRLKSVNKSISCVIADQDFIRDYNHRSRSATWLFVYKKRWHRDSMLHGYNDCSLNGWFIIVIADMLKSVVPPGEDLYLLTATGNFFLFALNNSQEVISVNPMSRTVRRIPPSPLGPRGTSSWRRSGMKLFSRTHNSGHFRFLFAEMIGNQPVLFEYDSETDSWTSTDVEESDGGGSGGVRRESTSNKTIFLSAYNGRSGSVVIAKGTDDETDQAEYANPVVLRPRFIGLGDDNDRGPPLAVGFSWGNRIDCLHVYGDGNVMIIKSCDLVSPNKRVMRMLIGIELFGLNSRGNQWELISKVPIGVLEKIRKPYGAMMGCMEQRFGVVRAVLMSNLEGVWDIIWLCYDLESKTWDWVPIVDCRMKGANMAGIAFSFGLSLN